MCLDGDFPIFAACRKKPGSPERSGVVSGLGGQLYAGVFQGATGEENILPKAQSSENSVRMQSVQGALRETNRGEIKGDICVSTSSAGQWGDSEPPCELPEGVQPEGRCPGANFGQSALEGRLGAFDGGNEEKAGREDNDPRFSALRVLGGAHAAGGPLQAETDVHVHEEETRKALQAVQDVRAHRAVRVRGQLPVLLEPPRGEE